MDGLEITARNVLATAPASLTTLLRIHKVCKSLHTDLYARLTLDTDPPEGYRTVWTANELFARARQARYVCRHYAMGNRVYIDVRDDSDTVAHLDGPWSGSVPAVDKEAANLFMASGIGQKVAYHLMCRERAENLERRILMRTGCMPHLLLRADIQMTCSDIVNTPYQSRYVGRAKRLRTLLLQLLD